MAKRNVPRTAVAEEDGGARLYCCYAVSSSAQREIWIPMSFGFKIWIQFTLRRGSYGSKAPHIGEAATMAATADFGSPTWLTRPVHEVRFNQTGSWLSGHREDAPRSAFGSVA